MLGFSALLLEIGLIIIPPIAAYIWIRDWHKNRSRLISLMRGLTFILVFLLLIPLIHFRFIDQINLYRKLQTLDGSKVAKVIIGSRWIDDPSQIELLVDSLKNQKWHFDLNIDNLEHTPFCIQFADQSVLYLEIRVFEDHSGALVSLRNLNPWRGLHWTRGYVYIDTFRELLEEQGIPLANSQTDLGG